MTVIPPMGDFFEYENQKRNTHRGVFLYRRMFYRLSDEIMHLALESETTDALLSV